MIPFTESIIIKKPTKYERVFTISIGMNDNFLFFGSNMCISEK